MKQLIVLFFLFSISVSSIENDVLSIVANKNVKVEELKQNVLRKIYLGKTTKWDNGSKIVPVVCNDRNTLGKFTSQIMNMSVNRYKIYWKKKIFTGKGSPPKEVKDAASLIKFVKLHDNAIGFLTGPVDSTEVTIIRTKE